MVAEYLILGTSVALAKDAVSIEYLKSKHLELSDDEKQAFMQDENRRFVHFTSKESADKIMESGFLIPTKGVLQNHFTKTIDSKGKKKDSELVYMFDSANFNVDDYIRNLPKDRSPFNGCYEYYAVTTRPDEYEINNFKRRAQDGAITYEGRLDIDGTDTKLVKYVLDLDEHGEYKLDEVPMDFKYEPSQELIDRLAKDKMGILKYTLTTYMSDVRKTKTSFKKYKIEKDKYKEQMKKKKEFAKANKQFIEEQKEKNYVFQKEGRTIVVKNVEYEEVGGKKLQKLAIVENGDETKKKKLQEATKFCYMDEYNLDDIDSKVATEYFFNNLDNIKDKQSNTPEYIGLPLENLETGEITNEYDTTFDKTFKEYMDRRQETKDIADKKYEELKNSKKWTRKIKNMFSKIFNRNKHIRLLEQSNEHSEGTYPNSQEENPKNKKAIMFSLSGLTKSDKEMAEYYNNEKQQESKTIENKTVEEI